MTTFAPAADRQPDPAGTRPRVLVVDDDPTVAEVVCRYLRAASFDADAVGDGISALAAAEAQRPDLVVLDRMLPGMDGLEVCRRLRATWSVPVILLTALGEQTQRVDGLDAGADDYLAKPFSPRELVLRVQSVLRRSSPPPLDDPVVRTGAFSLDHAAREIRLNDRPLALTVREFDLLSHLLTHQDRSFSREELLQTVWGWAFGDLSTVTVHVRRLREKIEPDPARPRHLTTVWGVGYRFTAATPAAATPVPVIAPVPAIAKEAVT